jgi:hypothetical protein
VGRIAAGHVDQVDAPHFDAEIGVEGNQFHDGTYSWLIRILGHIFGRRVAGTAFDINRRTDPTFEYGQRRLPPELDCVMH